MAPACNLAIAEFLFYTWDSVDADKLTSIAVSKRHLCRHGFGREAKLFPILLVEAIALLALLVATVDCLAVRFAVSAVERTASSIC